MMARFHPGGSGFSAIRTEIVIKTIRHAIERLKLKGRSRMDSMQL